MSHNATPADAVRFAYELKALVPALNAALTEVFHPIGLSCVQADALMALDELQPITLRGLSGHLVAESGHPSRLIARLESMGLVERAPAPGDRRAALLSLTTDGAQKAAEARAAREPVARRLAEEFGSVLPGLIDALSGIRRELDGSPDAADRAGEVRQT